jgi:hypothetical protein
MQHTAIFYRCDALIPRLATSHCNNHNTSNLETEADVGLKSWAAVDTANPTRTQGQPVHRGLGPSLFRGRSRAGAVNNTEKHASVSLPQ